MLFMSLCLLTIYCGNVMHAFCELWCPLTNTLHTPHGELSISLWDLRSLDGLPIDGAFYDEVVSSAKELLCVDDEGIHMLSPSCKFLFFALGRLVGDDLQSVSFETLTQLLFQGPRRHTPLPL